MEEDNGEKFQSIVKKLEVYSIDRVYFFENDKTNESDIVLVI